MTVRLLALVALVFSLATPAHAQWPAGFKTGPLIKDYGPAADIDGRLPFAEDATFKIAYDMTQAGRPGEVNQNLETAARFLNMHALAGVKPENMSLAIVVHGSIVHDVTKDAVYEAKYGKKNANAPMIAALIENGVEVYMCGQSALVRGVKTEDLLPGVKMSLTAMSTHALLQQRGYTLNPF